MWTSKLSVSNSFIGSKIIVLLTSVCLCSLVVIDQHTFFDSIYNNVLFDFTSMEPLRI